MRLFPFVLLIPIDFTTLTLDTQEVLQSKYGAIPLPSLVVKGQIYKGISPEDDLSSIFLNAMVDSEHHQSLEVLSDHSFSHESKYDLFTAHFCHHFSTRLETEWMSTFFVVDDLKNFFNQHQLIEALKSLQNSTFILTNVRSAKIRRKRDVEQFWNWVGQINAEVFHVNLQPVMTIYSHPFFFLKRVKMADFIFGSLSLDPSRVKFNLLTSFVPLLKSAREISKNLRPLNRKCRMTAEILELILES